MMKKSNPIAKPHLGDSKIMEPAHPNVVRQPSSAVGEEGPESKSAKKLKKQSKDALSNVKEGY